MGRRGGVGGMYVQIGGIEQWIQIGTENRDNPVLLFLHGGPGGSSRPAAAAWRSWEECFIVVHWDQRGAGLTLSRNGEERCGPLTVDRIVNDGIEVVDFLRSRLEKAQILLVGHSWGSVLGVHMLKRRPELFSAYVGTGQMVNKRRNEEVNYRRLVAQAKAAENAEASATLAEIGPSPFLDRDKVRKLRQLGDALASGNGDDVFMRPHPLPSEFTQEARELISRGRDYSSAQLFAEMCNVDLPSLGLAFETPMFCFHGSCDQQTPIELAEQYFADIRAPTKEFVCLEGCHHFVVFNRPDAFLSEMLARVRPIVVGSR